jgi:cell division protein FtsB
MEPEPKLDKDIKSIELNTSTDESGSGERNSQTNNSQPDKVKNKNHGSKKPFIIILTILIVLSLMVIAASAAYLWRDNAAIEAQNKQNDEIAILQKAKADLVKQVKESKVADTVLVEPEPTTCTAKAPTAAVIENIKASITSGNTAALAGYMAPSVNVILAATEGVGPSTPTVAVSNISNFITSVNTAWDYNFSLPAATISSYSTGGYKQYFPTIAVVGKASNGKVISFSFDCDGKISTVFMAVGGELL